MNRGALGRAGAQRSSCSSCSTRAASRASSASAGPSRVGDKVMQIENDYDKEVYNGDIGLVASIDPTLREMVIVRRPQGRLRLRRTGRAGARLRHHHPQGAGLRVPGRRDSPLDAALSDAAAQPALHRRHARQAPGRAGRAAKGAGHRGPRASDEASLVEARRMARRQMSALVVVATRAPALRIASMALAPSPGCRSTAAMASVNSVTAKPSASADSTDAFTQ